MQRWTAILACLCVMGLGPLQSRAMQEESNRPKPQRITLNLDQASLKNTLEMLTAKLGKNLLLDSAVQDVPLNMSLKDITPGEALNAILGAYDLSFREMQGGIYYVALSEKIVKQTVLKNIKLRYADADELQKVLEQMVVSDRGSIMSDKRTNTLIIKESPDVLAKIENLIQELDQPIKQIYIQAEILEISSTNTSETGVEWLWKTANINSLKGRIGTNYSLQSNAAGLGEEQQQTVVNDDFPFPTGAGLGIGILNTDIEAVLHALKEINNVNLLSRPRLVTMDNQEATIEVGDQIPYKKLNEFGVTSFEFKDATVQLVVKPHIIDSEYILLEVAPKADFQNGFTPDGTPIISTRKASTTVKVKNGQTIVIGGLIRDSIINSESQVPILGSIPILGFLFKSKKASKVKTELIVFITPTILREDDTGKVFENEFRTKENFQKTLN